MRAVNLIPSDQRSGGGSLAGRSGGAALILLALIFGVVVLAVLYGTATRTVSKETDEIARIETQIAQVQARTGRLQPYVSFVQTAEQRTKTVAQLVQARFDWSHMLHELGRVLPANVSLQTFSGTIGAGVARVATSTSANGASAAAPPSSSTPPGSVPSLSLSGCTTSQAEVARMLQQLKLMDGVAEVALHSSNQANSKPGGGGASGSAGAGGCGKVNFSVTVTFAALPSTPLPNVAPVTPAATPVSNASAKDAHAEQVSSQQKRAQR